MAKIRKSSFANWRLCVCINWLDCAFLLCVFFHSGIFSHFEFNEEKWVNGKNTFAFYATDILARLLLVRMSRPYVSDQLNPAALVKGRSNWKNLPVLPTELHAAQSENTCCFRSENTRVPWFQDEFYYIIKLL